MARYVRKGPFPGPTYTDTVLFEAFDAGIYEAHADVVGFARRFVEKIKAGLEDVSLLVLGDSTTLQGTTTFPRGLANRLATQFPTHSVVYRDWNTTSGTAYNSPTTVQTGSGSRTIQVRNAGVGSTSAQYPLGSRFQTEVLDTDPDVVIINHGHNHNTIYEWHWAIMSAFTEQLAWYLPDAQIFLCAQNPRNDGGTQSELSTTVAWLLAEKRGYGVIDFYNAFKANPTWIADWMADTIHPNTAGAVVMADEAYKAFDVTKRYPPQPDQQPSAFVQSSENLLYNSLFKAFPGKGSNNVPTSWTRNLGSGSSSVAEPGTLSEISPNPVRLRNTVSGVIVWMYQTLDATQRARIAGKRVTLAVRVHIPAANQTGVGRIYPYITWSAGASVASGSPIYVEQGVTDRWVWATVSYDVPSTVPTDITFGVQGQNASGVVDFTVDRATLAIGSFPTEWTAALADPAPEPNPVTDVFIYDDFLGGGDGNVLVGNMNWQWSGGTFSSLVGEANHPGINKRDTGTSAGTYAWTLSKAIQQFAAAETWDVTWIVRLNANDSSTTVRIGVAQDVSDPPNNGTYVEKLSTDTSWFGVTRASATQTRTAALATATTGWLKVRVRRVNSTTIGFTLDAGTEVLATANIPTGPLRQFLVIGNTAAAASKTIDVDYADLKISGLVR